MGKDTESIRNNSAFARSVKSFISEHLNEFAAEKTIPINPHLVPFYGDWETAAFITQLLFWQERAGGTGGWVYKTYEEWEGEVKIKRLSLIRRIEQLSAIYLEKGKPQMFAGKKKTRLRINKVKYLECLEQYLSSNDSKVSQ